jgi:hypothetical protein
MEIIVHGTKGGYHVFSPTKSTGLIDARPDYNKVAAIGNHAYSIGFLNETVVFSKYKIIRDVKGEKRTGNIAFSLIISKQEKISGADVIILLDQISNQYCNEYIFNDNLSYVREDWSFLNEITETYRKRLIDNPDYVDSVSFQQGSEKAAFVFYNSHDKLQKFFDAPYQEEYIKYEQVFFVDEKYKSKIENPLNALRHGPTSDLTEKIDLDQYTLYDTANEIDGMTIEVRIRLDGSWITLDHRKRIRKNTELQITYKKQHHETKAIEGKWEDLSPVYLDIDKNSKTIKLREDISLYPTKKVVLFTLKDNKNNQLKVDKIICKRKHSEGRPKEVNTNEAIFEAEEIYDIWVAEASIGNFIGEKEFIPNKTSNVNISLQEHKKLTIYIFDENDDIIQSPNIAIDGRVQSNDNPLELDAKELDKKLTLYIVDPHSFYESKIQEIIPSKIENNTVKINLQKKKELNKTIGIKKYDEPEKKIKLNTNKLPADGDEKPTNRIRKRISVIIGSLLLIVGAFFFFQHTNFFSRMPNVDSSTEILNYCKGIELKEEKLDSYLTTYCNNSNTNKKTNDIVKHLKRAFGVNQKSKSKTSKPNYCLKLENAIILREAINKGIIESLINYNYSKEQGNFKNAVSGIDEIFKEKIGETMNYDHDRISKMNLNEIADYLVDYQQLLQIRTKIKRITEINQLKDIKDEISNSNFPVDSIKKNVKSEIENKIITLRQKQKQKPTTPKQTHDPKDSQSNITLKMHFWDLVRSGNVTKESYDELLHSYKNNNRLTADEKGIIDFLNRICTGSSEFARFRNIREIERKSDNTSIQKLNDLFDQQLNDSFNESN